MSIFPSVEVICQNSSYLEALSYHLANQGIIVTRYGVIKIILDFPYMSGEPYVKTLSSRSIILITDNPCPEYLMNMRMLDTAGFIGGKYSLEHIILAINALSASSRFFKHPNMETSLTQKECFFLKLLAKGMTVDDLSFHLSITAQTARNQISAILSKVRADNPALKIDNRTHLILYYLGCWHLLQHSIESYAPAGV